MCILTITCEIFKKKLTKNYKKIGKTKAIVRAFYNGIGLEMTMCYHNTTNFATIYTLLSSKYETNYEKNGKKTTTKFYINHVINHIILYIKNIITI